MVKHTQTICRMLPTNCLNVFYHFVGLALKGLSLNCICLTSVVYCICLTNMVNQGVTYLQQLREQRVIKSLREITKHFE